MCMVMLALEIVLVELWRGRMPPGRVVVDQRPPCAQFSSEQGGRCIGLGALRAVRHAEAWPEGEHVLGG